MHGGGVIIVGVEQARAIERKRKKEVCEREDLSEGYEAGKADGGALLATGSTRRAGEGSSVRELGNYSESRDVRETLTGYSSVKSCELQRRNVGRGVGAESRIGSTRGNTADGVSGRPMGRR